VPVYFHVEHTDFEFENKNRIKRWLKGVCLEEGKKCGSINIVALSDGGLLEMNRRYLGRNYYTDVIAFNAGTGEIISGDIYISAERIAENAETLNVDFYNELCRVIVHGLLHLIGYQDNTTGSKLRMTEKEDYYLGKNALNR